VGAWFEEQISPFLHKNHPFFSKNHESSLYQMMRSIAFTKMDSSLHAKSQAPLLVYLPVEDTHNEAIDYSTQIVYQQNQHTDKYSETLLSHHTPSGH